MYRFSANPYSTSAAAVQKQWLFRLVKLFCCDLRPTVYTLFRVNLEPVSFVFCCTDRSTQLQELLLLISLDECSEEAI